MASGSFSVASTNTRVAATLKWTSTPNTAGNYSDVYCELRASRTNSGYETYGTGSGYITINGTKVSFSITSSQKITQNSNTLLGSGTVRVYHADNGSKTITISAYASIPGASLTLGATSGSATLDTIPRKSTMTVSNGTLGTAQTLTVTRQSTSFTHTITYECGSYNGTICTKSTSTSVSFTPSLDFANGAPNGTSVYVSFTITTYNGDTSIGSNSYAIWCSIPASVVPTVSLTVSDSTGYLTTFGACIQSKSKFDISVTASGKYGSTIKSYKVTANNNTYTTASVITGVITSSGTVPISVTVTDSRGRTASTTVNVTVLAYSNPKISSINVKRCDSSGAANSSGAYLGITFSASITSLNNKNTKSYKVKYKKKSATSYTTVDITSKVNSYTATNYNYVFEASTDSSYDIELIVSDHFTSVTSIQNGSAITKLFSAFKKGLGWAFGKVAELEDTLEVAFKAKFYKPVTMESDLTIQGGIQAGGGVRYVIPVTGGDLNTILVSGKYYMGNDSTNRPENANGWLEVQNYGNGDYCYQQYVTYTGNKYERWRNAGTWGEWQDLNKPAQKLLWYGGYYMTANQTVDFLNKETISKQRHGIVLVFNPYIDDVVKDYDFVSVFVPKYLVSLKPGKEHTFHMTRTKHASVATKILQIYDDRIVGSANNSASGTANGVTYNNASFVLRYVIGV